MDRFFIWLSIAALFISGAAGLTTAVADEPKVEFYSYTHESLFPSAIISTATVDWNGDEQNAEDRADLTESIEGEQLYGDENGWLGVTIENAPDEAEVEVTLRCGELLGESKWKGKLKSGHTSVRIMPKAAWKYSALHSIREERPETLSIIVTINDEVIAEKSETVIFKSLRDCPYYVFLDKQDPESLDDISFVFAAYVNENHPWIDGVLKEAIETGIVDSFTGYQSGDANQVKAQVFAIWTALKARGITYSDVSTSTPNQGVAAQTVRFMDECIEAKQANCVDGSVLLASILRKIGLHVHLVMVPGHCFLAFDLDEKGEETQGLETTLIGDVSGDEPEELDSELAKLKSEINETAFACFASALASGDAQLEEHAEGFESAEDPDIQMISVNEARKMGIKPIATGKRPSAK
jgi:hypothetical protein